jgi:CPA1 family monovalent cation:H+ antiporter
VSVLALEVAVALGVAILVSTLLARRFRVAPPVLLLVCGVLLGYIPAFAGVHLPPAAVLLLFLPALLYWESITTSLREIRANLRGVVLMSTLLVFITAGVVACLAHLFGLPWGPAWVLGAAVAPTDATAVGALTRSLPRRNVTLLRAESLINDGTALVLYSIAVAVTVGEMRVDALAIGWSFVLAYGGGALAGVLVATVAVYLRRRVTDPMSENVAIILTPFTAFLLAEMIHASGVLAVVIAGLIMSQEGPRIGRAPARQVAESFWSLSTFLLNGSLFVLVGIQLPAAVRGLSVADFGIGLLMVGAVAVTSVAVRFAFLFGATYLIRLLDRRPAQKRRRVSNRARVVSGMAGFRGAVSLAAALAIPVEVSGGASFPARDLIVFVTAGVVVVTIVGQGLALPAIVRWAKLPVDSSVDDERLLAETTASETALAALPELAADLGTDASITEQVELEYREHVDGLHARADETSGPEGAADESTVKQRQMVALRLALLHRKRQTVIALRDERRIDDIVLRQVQDKLDIEEVRLTGRADVE